MKRQQVIKENGFAVGSRSVRTGRVFFAKAILCHKWRGACHGDARWC
ncbi:MAG: hypothetical protein ACMUIP_17820 [bacterium]